MPNKLKELVSKKKIRYQKDGFDLDLTYITSRIIAMGFPAQSWEGIYRNHIDDVVNFFCKNHRGHYQIYNLCNERHIDEQKFEQDSINHRYPFNDHNPPMFTQMIACCKEIQDYLDSDKDNVVAIQCKAGKGRTGVIVCGCLLIQCPNMTAKEALEFYGKHRTTNGQGVTIPSQIRFIYYFAHYLRKELNYESLCLKFNHLVLDEMPNIPGNGCELQFVIYVYDQQAKNLKVIHTSRFYEAKKDSTRGLKLYSDNDIHLSDDLKFQFILKSKFGKKENLCHCWLNTFFIVHKPPNQSLIDTIKDIQNNENSLSAGGLRSGRKIDRLKSDISHKPKKTFTDVAQTDWNLSSNFQSSPETNLYKLTLFKHEIDKANKDVNNKTFPFNFSITFVFENAPHSNTQNLASPQKKSLHKHPISLRRGNTEKPKRPPVMSKIKEHIMPNNEPIRNLDSPNNSDNPYEEHSQSSESLTKSSSSDID